MGGAEIGDTANGVLLPDHEPRRDASGRASLRQAAEGQRVSSLADTFIEIAHPVGTGQGRYVKFVGVWLVDV